jgi:hypothetical protein
METATLSFTTAEPAKRRMSRVLLLLILAVPLPVPVSLALAPLAGRGGRLGPMVLGAHIVPDDKSRCVQGLNQGFHVISDGPGSRVFILRIGDWHWGAGWFPQDQSNLIGQDDQSKPIGHDETVSP